MTSAEISAKAHAILKKHWGYDSFRPMQLDIIESVMQGNDTLGLLPTGGGKSITFQVPALASEGLTIVVTPLISLMKDQVDNLRQQGVMAGQLNHAMRHAESELVLKRCQLGKIKILYLSPEKLRSTSLDAWWNVLDVTMIVVDEAHCISQWGYDFRPSYLLIHKLRERYPQALVLALTASATPEVVTDIMDKLAFRNREHVYRLSFTRRNISYVVRRCDFKDTELEHILSRVEGCGIVYTRSRKRTRELAEFLNKNGISADYYHAGLSAEEKNEKQNRWKQGETRIMVATNAFGMGIDKPDVRIVVHHDLPSSLEEYYQEAGRAGRDGLPSWAVVLATRGDKGVLSRRLAESFPEKEFIRDLYQKVCVFLGIAMGEGYDHNYEFNFSAFCERYSLSPVMADSALRILSQSGHFDYTEELNTRARLMMKVTRRALYDISFAPETERVLQFVLRNYTGIFADYEYIRESFIASSLDLTERTVYEALIKLRKMGVIDFVPRRRSPYIYMVSSRQPVQDILLPKTVYEQRREQMSQRIEAMKRFVFDDTRCRVMTMLEYFGEEAHPCGTCDVCRAEKARKEAHSRDNARKAAANAAMVEQAVEYVTRGCTDGIAIRDLAARLDIPLETLLPAVRSLVDKCRLRYSDGIVYPFT